MAGQGSTPPAGSRRRPRGGDGTTVTTATARPEQALVDAEEHASEERYRSLCQLGLAIEDAMRRAEAMTRLELALAKPGF